ncbi:MAG: peptidase M75 [Bacteroidia bacterium]|nr:peptidase M75 [Bacteroidia bacterium]
MKKNFFYVAALSLGLTLSATSCSDDDKSPSDWDSSDAANVEYVAANASSWGNYMQIVASLLKADAATLYCDWSNSYNGGASYAQIFKEHKAPFSSAKSCVEQLIDGCYDIANEVGTAKIGEPYDFYMSGDKTSALYAVESWYSWHSRDDYRNNIYSIRNAYYGSLNGQVASSSLSAVIAKANVSLDVEVKKAISDAAVAIYAIPDPFRNHIGSAESSAAMVACATLANVLTNKLKPAVTSMTDKDEAALKGVVANYVDVVVLPTYASLKTKTENLYEKVETFRLHPTNAHFSAAATAWLEAREPWETSEAFLFGPVADKGLDPNMDSWPLDQAGIVQILKSGNYADLNWNGDYDEESKQISAAQGLRGFHTLEFLLFKNGEPRLVSVK